MKGNIDCDRAKAKIESKRSMIVPNPICHSHTGTHLIRLGTHTHDHTQPLSFPLWFDGVGSVNRTFPSCRCLTEPFLFPFSSIPYFLFSTLLFSYLRILSL